MMPPSMSDVESALPRVLLQDLLKVQIPVSGDATAPPSHRFGWVCVGGEFQVWVWIEGCEEPVLRGPSSPCAFTALALALSDAVEFATA